MDRLLTVRCTCGWETTGSADAVVDASSDHGQRVHNMSATREQILATAVESSIGASSSAPSIASSKVRTPDPPGS